jgi:hypothetical protein
LHYKYVINNTTPLKKICSTKRKGERQRRDKGEESEGEREKTKERGGE